MTPWQRYNANHYGALFSFPFLFVIVAFLWPPSALRTFTLVMSGIGTLMFGYGLSWARDRKRRLVAIRQSGVVRYRSASMNERVSAFEVDGDRMVLSGDELDEIALIFGFTRAEVIEMFRRGPRL